MDEKITLTIDGMHCAGCEQTIKALTDVSGVQEVHVGSWQEGTPTVRATEETDPETLIQSVEETGYSASATQIEEQPTPEEDDLREENQSYDLAIIGGGSAAFAAAIEASKLGGKAAIINDGLPIGGTCVNVGCIPSKTLLRAGETRYRSVHHNFRGITSESRVTDFQAIIEQKRELITALRQEKYIDAIADDPDISIIEGRGQLAGKHAVEVGGETVRAANILIATGASPSVPPIPGLEEAGYLTNETVYHLNERPERLIILGGGYIGLENAQLFHRLGTQVTIIEQMDQILPTEEPYLAEALEGYLAEEGITIHTGATVRSSGREGETVSVEFASGGRTDRVKGSHILVAAGRRGNTDDLGLQELGIELRDHEYLSVDDILQTNRPHIFGAGDVIGEQQFVYTAAHEGQVAARNALRGDNEQPDYSALPWVVFTDPQIAGVGMDEKEARQAGIDAEVAQLSLEEVPRALAARDARGFIRLIRNRADNQLVGARILAPEGSELLMELTLAIKHGLTVDEITSTLHPYLTLSEGVKLAALTFSTDVKKLSCCAG